MPNHGGRNSASMVNLCATLDEGGIPVGAALIVPSVDVVEILSYHFDWVLVDLEHSTIPLSELPNVVRTAERWDTAVVVRVAAADQSRVNRILDAGAHGIVYPHLGSAADAEAAVAATYYPPLGERSIGYARAQRYGADRVETVRTANDAVLCAGLIEDVEGLGNLDSIVAVDGLDALMVGPNDLAASRGRYADAAGDDDIFDVDADVERIARTAREHGVAFGYPAVDPDDLADVLELGSQLLLTNFAAAMLNETAERFASDARDAIDAVTE